MKVYTVDNLSKIDLTRYNDGDFFLTKKTVAIIHNNKLEPLVKQSDIKKMIQDELKKVKLKDEK